MQFIDEANIQVVSGRGGNGVASFRREKYIPFGGPNGGDGGDGGNVYLKAEINLNTLVDFRYVRQYKSENGQGGMGQQKTGRCGKDLNITVPVGTKIYDIDTQEFIGDLTQNKEKILVAKGGRHGLGNIHFKSSRNRTPRQFTLGEVGEEINLRLELSVLADVGLLGLPNAGKSSLITAVSAARPKVADYPFTTLHPNLGVVAISSDTSFVIADIPGLIAGAAEGSGLGIQFLKHLSRTKLLLHIVDLSPINGVPILDSIRVIEHELEKYSNEIFNKPRWLVFNKSDLLPEEETSLLVKKTLDSLGWKAPFFIVSAEQRYGTKQLINSIAENL